MILEENSENLILSAAINLAKLGFHIFPCRPNNKVPATSHGSKDAINEANGIRRMFTATPDANLAVATGHGGLVVLDFDTPDGPQVFEAAHGQKLPATVKVRTPRDGWHYYFRSAHKVRNSTNKLGANIDVRGIGGYVLCPPSAINGKNYSWIPGCAPWEREIAMAPEWLLGLLTRPSQQTQRATATPATPIGDSAANIPERLLLDALAQTQVGTRNDVGFRLACQLRDAGVTRKAAEAVIVRYVAGVPQTEDQPYTLSEAQHSLEQAFSRPATTQRQPEEAAIDSLLEGVTLWHVSDREGMATIIVNGHQENWPIRSRSFKHFICGRFYIQTKKAMTDDAWRDWKNSLEARAVYAGSVYETAIRIGQTTEAIYLDLADDQWRVVRITASGWQVISSADCPIKFIRRRGMKPLPIPLPDGSIDQLRTILKVELNESWILLVAWLLGVFRPEQPQAILSVTGEQGSGKSILSRMVREIVDPNQSSLRRPPKEEIDLFVAARSSLVLTIDNLSGLQPWLSDALCSLATGGGLARRQLYSDDEEVILEARRPIILNGIEDVATRPDLLDRSLQIHLPAIADQRRQTEEFLVANFARVHAQVLGALLTAVAAGLKNLSGTKVPNPPRMADFARWIVACEPVLPWDPGAFLRAYLMNRSKANIAAIEASPVASAIVELMERTSSWSGTYTALLAALIQIVGDTMINSKHWPTSSRGLSAAIERCRPNLRALGVHIGDVGRDPKNRRKVVTIIKSEVRQDEKSPTAPP